MIFASLEFLTLFLPLFFGVYFLTPQRYRNLVLLTASWLFYGWWSPVYLVLFIALAFVGWLGGLAVAQASARERQRFILKGMIVAMLCILCWYKYTNIVVETLASLSPVWLEPLSGWQRIALPIGLSFTVLQVISYVADVYRKTTPAEPKFTNFAMYLAMFGHLVAGPIIRYDWIRRELIQRTVSWTNFCTGARRFMVGMSMKVLIADTLSPIVAVAFAQPQPGLGDAWLGCAGYTLQLYFDFAGYSAMAIGIGLMLGFHFPENFNHPYLATSIQDFWRRWHISLSSWLRDYLYVALGGNRVSPWKIYRNLILVMAIGGLWHGGDSWNYLFWGLAHGLALAVTRFCSARGWVIPQWSARIITLVYVMFAWTLFRSTDLHQAGAVLGGQIGLHGTGVGDAMALALRPSVWMAYLAGVVCVVIPALRFSDAWRAREAVAWWSHTWPVVTFLLSFLLVASRGSAPFLYFQF